MDSSPHLSTLGCEIRLIRAKNIELKPNESLFVRCYLYASNNTRVKLNTHEISSHNNTHLFWNKKFSLECFGNIDTLSKSVVIFELRKNISIPILGKVNKSFLLGRAEVPWQSVFETKKREIENWVYMNVNGDEKPPAIQVVMKLVGVPVVVERRRGRRVVECGGECGSSGCGGWDMFSLD